MTGEALRARAGAAGRWLVGPGAWVAVLALLLDWGGVR